ncbi:MAG: hypothetical protein AAF288_11485 [Planctomycetota bacterium]
MLAAPVLVVALLAGVVVGVVETVQAQPEDAQVVADAAVEDAGEALTLGQPIDGRFAGGERERQFRFEAPEPGMLFVAVEGGAGEGDFTLDVATAQGVALQDGHSDSDIGGMATAERVAAGLTEAGAYRVTLSDFGNDRVDYRLVASFVPMEITRPVDPDGGIPDAEALELGRTIKRELDADRGDKADWYRVPVGPKGYLGVIARADHADLVLSVYKPDDLNNAEARSDQDLFNDLGHEALLLILDGETEYLLKVEVYDGACRYDLQLDAVPLRNAPGLAAAHRR